MITTRDIAFDVRVHPDAGGDVEVVPRVGGELLTDLIGDHAPSSGPYGGLVPARYRFGAMHRHFRGGVTEVFRAGATPVLGCACGEWSCRPLWCRITVADYLVAWDRFPHPGFGPFLFTRGAYEDALAELALALA